MTAAPWLAAQRSGGKDHDLGLPEGPLHQPMIATVSEGGEAFALASISQSGLPPWT